MKRKLIIINTVVVFVSLFIMLLVSCLFVVTNSQNDAKIKLNEYLKMATRIYNGSNSEYTVNSLFSSESNIRITIIDSNGTVLADSSVESLETNHLDRPELKDLNNIYTRYSDTLGVNMYYLACEDNGAYIRVAIPEAKVDSEVLELVLFGSLALLIILGLSILIIIHYSKRIFEPLNLQIAKFSDLTGINISSNTSNEEKLALSFDKIHDILEDKIEEIELEKNKVYFVINHINQGFILIDNYKKIKLINKEALQILGFSNENFIGKDYMYLVRNQEIQAKIEELYLIKDNCELEFSNKNKHYKVYMTYQENNICIFIVDVTRDHNMIQMKKEFFDYASHELKSPLTTIIGYQQLISQGILTDSKEIEDATERTIKEANRMNQIIIEMLELSKLESEDKPINLENVKIKDSVNLCLDSKEYQVNEKKIEVNTDMDDSTIEIASSDFNQLIKNLIDNAIIYNKEKGKINITVKNKIITIEDTGIGIKPEHINRIFERFYRVDKSKSKDEGGTGLGLALVKHICILYGFDIKVESSFGIGTKFIINCNKK